MTRIGAGTSQNRNMVPTIRIALANVQIIVRMGCSGKGKPTIYKLPSKPECGAPTTALKALDLAAMTRTL